MKTERRTGYDPNRYSHTAYEPYQPPNYSTPPQADKFAHLNQQAFAANNAVSPGVSTYMPVGGPVALSCQPTSGVVGTKVFVRFSMQYDIFSLSSTMPFFFLQFGSERCPTTDVTREVREAQEPGYVYTCTADAPQQQILVTGNEPNVPLSLVIEGAAGDEISRTGALSFQYLQGQGVGSGDDITRTASTSKQQQDSVTMPGGPSAYSSSSSSSTVAASNAQQQQSVADHGSVSPRTGEPQLAVSAGAAAAGTNNYDEPSQHGPYASTGYTQGANAGDMITTYRSSSFTEPPFHHRRSAHAWSGFAPTTLGSSLRSPLLHHHGRSGMAPLPIPSSTGTGGTPQLVRTSTIAHPGGGAGPYNSVSLYTTKAVLKINGRLDGMAESWTQEEWSNRRRIVMFRRSQQGSTLTASCKPVSVNERPPNSICVSCIYWAEKGKCYVTSVDTIYLLEQLVAAPNRFSVEEKNRIRRNLEGFHPVTVSKSKDESEEFFKLIMAFPNPKPRNIEKDVKVFPWEILESALKKIIGKYSANPTNTLPPANMVAPAHSPYTALPTPPGQGSISSQASEHHSQYSVHSSHHHDAIPSPRSLSGSGSTWAPYTASGGYSASTSTAPNARTLSPALRQPSPQHPPSIRVNTNHSLPSVTSYDTRTGGGYASTGLHTPISHHPSTSTPPRWDATPANYASDPYPSLSSTHHSQVYGNTAPSYLESSVSRT